MKHFHCLLVDAICSLQDAYNRLRSIFCKKQKPSLIIENVLWFTNSAWMERLIAYKQLDLWTYVR